MKIHKIHLENFRNFETLDVTFDDVNIIWGENAQGKTNLLEALYLFTGSRSFRGAREQQLIKIGTENARLQLGFEGSGREQTAEISLGEKKEILLNGVKKRSAAQLGDEIKAVIFSPVHLSIVKDGPAERRQFIDGALCQIKSNYSKLLSDYHKTVQQRNALLKDMEKHPELEDMLFIWNRNLAKTGAKIIYQRLKYIEAITPYLHRIYEGISRSKEEIILRYSSSGKYETDPEQIERALFRLLEESGSRDKLNLSTSEGPHRDDIEILINGKSARLYGSQGQQRSCVLAMKLAEAELLKKMTGIEPVALLDDVMSELDESRQDYILNSIEGRQVFITCCDKEQILRLKKGKTIHMENGAVCE